MREYATIQPTKIKIVYEVKGKQAKPHYYQDEQSAYQDLQSKVKQGFIAIRVEKV